MLQELLEVDGENSYDAAEVDVSAVPQAPRRSHSKDGERSVKLCVNAVFSLQIKSIEGSVSK